MAIVLIVSKTQMRNGVCVGGIVESTGELIRIHNERGGNLSSDAPYEIGERWELEIKPAWNVRQSPHIEDKQVSSGHKIESIGLNGVIDYIKSHDLGQRLVSGSLERAFEECLHLCGTKNYISTEKVPSFSTQFWITDTDLIHSVEFEKHYYYYGEIRLKFVGFQSPIARIPAGSIIRLSLANWWDGDGSGENRCYLQLSGWYI